MSVIFLKKGHSVKTAIFGILKIKINLGPLHLPVLKTADSPFLQQEQFPGAPVGRALTDNRMANLPFCFKNRANEEGLILLVIY